MAAGHGFQWWNLLHNDFLNHHPHFSAAVVTVGGMAAAAVAYRLAVPKTKFAECPDTDLVPPKKFGIQNSFELVGEFIQGLGKDVIGPGYAKFFPLLLFIFIWTLTNNLMGMVPGMGSSTADLNTTLSMGVFVFLYYNFMGFREHGFKYLEQYTGHLGGWMLLFLGPVMFCIETISHMVRPVTLGIRLRSNISGDHVIYSVIRDLSIDLSTMMGETFGVVGNVLGGIFVSLAPVPVVMLGLLVSVIQAFVFTLLTTIYIGLATAHEEH